MPFFQNSSPMVTLRVTLWVTLWGVLIHHAEALNSTSSSSSSPSNLALDHVIERSVELEHVEGSGYNGLVGPQFFSPFKISAPRFPPTAVIGLSRPLQRGDMPPHVEYVALWNPRGGAPHWGNVYVDHHLQIEGSFIQDGRVVNLTQPSMANEAIRLLQYIGTPESNNFKFVWVLARNLDVSTAISMKIPSDLCSPRLAPAVFQDDGYEFLGEADIDNRLMQYVFQGHVHVVEKVCGSVVQ
ncbi:unnamed protein product [Heligmosomoides polygyrus]|uniref:Uncharacterized protein n=1 Tax=Heligmosomoides polygyrus TaxID=6339 RepID=A0A3P8B2L7_HELPZ|nr:unnamed protein product [Heligmosomoides polygyrus]